MSDTEDAVPSADRPTLIPLKVEYCPHCGFPPEYCEFGPCWSQCKVYLEQHHPDLLAKAIPMSGPVDTESAASSSSSSADDVANDVKKLRFKDGSDNEEEEDTKEKEKKVKVKAKTDAILISKSQRQRNKFITTVKGLETVGDLKKIAQKCAKKFACSASVVKAADLSSEIAIQGDVMQDLPEFLVSEYPTIDKSTMYFYNDNKKKIKCF